MAGSIDFRAISGSPTVTHNVKCLLERKRGTLWRVEKGKLVKVEGFSNWVSYQWNKTEERAKVARVIDRTLRHIEGYLKTHADQAQAAAKALFDKEAETGIGRLGKTLYNHERLKTDSPLSRALLPEHTIRLKIGKDQFVDLQHESIDTTREESILPIDLGHEVSNANFKMLLERRRGCKFQVGTDPRPDQIDGDVQKAVTDVITRLGRQLKGHVLTHVEELAVGRIFAQEGPLCRMHRRVFSRGAIQEGSVLEGVLSKQLFIDLSKKIPIDLPKKREALGAALGMREISRKIVPTHFGFKRSIEEALQHLAYAEFIFTQSLGLELEKNGDGGSGGARYARDRYGRKMLVVKPDDEGPHGVHNPQWYARVKRLFVSPKVCLEGNSESIAEVDSWACDRHFDLWIVPPTELRKVVSRDFIGQSEKTCSVQMFVEGCKPLGEYVGVAPWKHNLPREYLRWYAGSTEKLGIFSLLPQREETRKELLARVPLQALEKAAAHNFLIEDVDCHFENILMKVADSSTLTPLPSTAREIEAFVGRLFEKNGHQQLLAQLLHSEVNGKGERIYLVKHDGGSSNPHEHPGWFDPLSKLKKHLFEVLPHFELPFSSNYLALNQDQAFEAFVKEKGKRDLKDVLEDIFEPFWEANETLFCQYLLASGQEVATHFKALMSALDKLYPGGDDKEVYTAYINYNLQRIRGNIRTRHDSYQVLCAHMKGGVIPMRSLFSDVISDTDFKKALKKDK